MMWFTTKNADETKKIRREDNSVNNILLGQNTTECWNNSINSKGSLSFSSSIKQKKISETPENREEKKIKNKEYRRGGKRNIPPPQLPPPSLPPAYPRPPPLLFLMN